MTQVRVTHLELCLRFSPNLECSVINVNPSNSLTLMQHSVGHRNQAACYHCRPEMEYSRLLTTRVLFH